MLVAAFTWEDLWRLALAVFLFAIGLSAAWFFLRLAGTVDRLSSLIKGTEESLLPVVDKVGGSVDRVNVQLDKVDQITDSAVDAADSVDTAVRAVSMAVTRPVTEGLRDRRRRQLRRVRFQEQPRLASRGAGREGRSRAARGRPRAKSCATRERQ